MANIYQQQTWSRIDDGSAMEIEKNNGTKVACSLCHSAGSASTCGHGPEGKAKYLDTPKTYPEWIICFDWLRLGTNDETTLSAMERGVLTWTSEVEERFSSQMFELIKFRTACASKRFQRNLDLAGEDGSEVVTALLALKRELRFLKRLTMLPVIPDEKQNDFARQIHDHAAHSQQAFEIRAKSDGSVMLGPILRKNRIDKV